MPLFACEFIDPKTKEVCNTLENTACVSDAWTRKIHNEPMFCSLHSDGRWHDRFKMGKVDWTKYKKFDGLLILISEWEEYEKDNNIRPATKKTTNKKTKKRID